MNKIFEIIKTINLDISIRIIINTLNIECS
jgi:hypothetical protein